MADIHRANGWLGLPSAVGVTAASGITWGDMGAASMAAASVSDGGGVLAGRRGRANRQSVGAGPAMGSGSGAVSMAVVARSQVLISATNMGKAPRSIR